MHVWNAALGIAAVMTGVAGCYGGTPTSSSGSASGGSGGYGSEEDAGAAGAPAMLAFVDTGRTLTATPGQGVGVFVTYQAGGQWLVQWTCDTAITSESCPFQIAVSALDAFDGAQALELVSDSLPPGASVMGPGATTMTVATTTTTELDDVSVLTAPGATLSVNVTLSGVPSGQYFFFVQNGQVNGGYTGALSDPLEFQPTSP